MSIISFLLHFFIAVAIAIFIIVMIHKIVDRFEKEGK